MSKRGSKIGNSLRNFRDRIRASVNVKSQNALFFTALLLIIVLAIMLRLSPLLRGPTLIKAFDPWIQYYNAKYLSEHSLYEYFHWTDLKSWFPEGYFRGGLRPGLTFSVVIIHDVINFIGIPISIYDVCYFFPAFMGGMTVFAAYLLGKEMLNRQCGLFAAFFLAFNTGHMQRTMAGFFDNETVGVFATLMTFFFFLKAIRTGKITHAVMGGVFLGFLSLSWGGYQYVFLSLPIIIGIMVLMNKYNEHMLIAYAGTQGVGLMIFSLFTYFNPGDLFSDLEVGGIFLFTIVLIIFHLIYTKKQEYPNLYNNILKIVVWLIIPGALIMAVLIWSAPDLIPFGFGRRLQSVLSPLLRDDLHIVASVAEHMPSAWSIFYYNTLIPLMLLPLGIFFCFKRLNAPEITLMVFLLTIFYMTGSMIRIILLFAPAAALMGAYGLVNVLRIYGTFVGERRQGVSRKRKRQLERTVGNSEVFAVYFLVGFLCVAQVVHAADISINQLSYSQMAAAGGQFHDWEESLMWMQTNLDGTDVVVSWWDYGYWLTPVGNVTTVNDNATVNTTRIGLTGMAMMQTNELYSAKILRQLDADYILVYFGFLVSGMGGDEGKWPWMVRICNDNYETYKKMGIEEDNWEINSVFDEGKYHNTSSGLRNPAWFDAQITRLMFYNELSDPNTAGSNYLWWVFANYLTGNPSQGYSQITDDSGTPWIDHLDIKDGRINEVFKVFKPAYISKNHMVKLYRVDYTALDSHFEIKNAKVLDNGVSNYAVFDLNNTGLRDLTIQDVSINGISYKANSYLGNDPITDFPDLLTNAEDVVWVDLAAQGTNFELDDVVNITVSAEADALEGSKYTFTNSTSNFFVTQAEPEAIRINRNNSIVLTPEFSGDSNVFIEVENIGASILRLDRYYVGNPITTYTNDNVTFKEGSSILEPGEKAYIEIPNVGESFWPYGQHPELSNIIAAFTANNVSDQTRFTGNLDGYKLSILDEERYLSPEIEAAKSLPLSPFSLYTTRNHIPFKLNETSCITYENGTTEITIDIKNTGETVLGLDSVYIYRNDGDTEITSDKFNWDPIDYKYYLNPNEENTIKVFTTEADLFETNEEIIISVTGIGYTGRTACSDIGFIFNAKSTPDLKILANIDVYNTSLVFANETGYLTVKNTGNQTLNIDKITVNNTDAINIEYFHGGPMLGVQEAALIKFDINESLLAVNDTNGVVVNISTLEGVHVTESFGAIPHPLNHALTINEGASSAVDGGNLIIRVENPGKENVTIYSLIINDTWYFPLEEVDLGADQFFELGAVNGFAVLTIGWVELEAYTMDWNDSHDIKVIVRTKEGAEDEIVLDIQP